MSGKTAIVTVLNDEYIVGALTTIYSFLKNTPNFNSDIIIFEWGDLSDINKTKIKKLYNKTFFKQINKELYKKCEYDTQYRIWTYNCNYRFEIFCLKEYDTVVFMDSDFLNLTSIAPLFNLSINFGIVKTLAEYVPQYTGKNCFDAGLMVIGKKYLKDSIRDDLIKLGLSPAPSIINDKHLWTSDEPILNVFFEKKKKTFLPQQFNFLTTLLDKDTDIYNNNFQFNGPLKPWMSNKLEDCFYPYTIKKIVKDNGTVKGLSILLKLHRLYIKYMDEAIAASS